MDHCLWRPSEHTRQACQLTHFIQFINQRYQLNITDYNQLHAFSITRISDFWQSVADFFDVTWATPATETYLPGEHMLDTQWFTGATLNFTENLLRHAHSDKTAILSMKEDGSTTDISYTMLHKQVARLSEYLRQQGIQPGDRVVGYTTNSHETVVAALATISLGAIWSSCATDLGIQGLLDRFTQIKPKLLFASDYSVYKGQEHSHQETLTTLLKALPCIKKTILIHNTKSSPYLLNNSISYVDALNSNTKTQIDYIYSAFDHPIYLLYSSGTTGKPKCMLHSAGGTLLQHIKEHALHTNITQDDRFFFYTTTGWMMWNWLISGLYQGATLILYDGCPTYPNVDKCFDLIDELQISICGVGAKLIESYAHQHLTPTTSHQLTSLKTLLTTASPLTSASFDYIYQSIKADVQVSSMSGGSDIISCFALGNPLLPVYRGELQCLGLGMNVDVYDDEGLAIVEQCGELVCKSPFPCMPTCFWDDPDNTKYQHTYFDRFDNTWTHGDFAQRTAHQGLIIHGRSDTTLNPGGMRFGTADIYQQLESIDEIDDAIAVGRMKAGNEQVILYVVLKNNKSLDDPLIEKIKTTIRHNLTPFHVPSTIIQAPELPRTLNGKLAELAVKKTINGQPIDNRSALSNPESLDFFQQYQ